MQNQRTLVIMAKAPRPGMVKTRLIESLSQQAVTEFYVCLLEDTMSLVRSLDNVNAVIMCPQADADELRRLVTDTARVVPQTGEGLASGLTSVFRHFAHDNHRVIAFNSDSPHLPASVLEGAFQELENRDLVVGPTDDGGYYLVGAKANHPTLFENDGLGTHTALERLLARAGTLKLSVGFTQTFYDVDIAADLVRLAADLETQPARAPRTAEWLKRWRSAVEQLRTNAPNL